MSDAIMTVWNVDLGLSVHIKAPNGRYIVVDLGSSAKTSPLSAISGQKIWYLVITHPHFDHFSDIGNIGGNEVLVLNRCKDYTREELMMGVDDNKKEIFKKYCDFVEGYGGPVKQELDPRKPFVFCGLTVEIFRPQGCDKRNINNHSAVTVVKYANKKIVICGDNEAESFSNLMDKREFRDAVKSSDILVAAHHGRESGYDRNFVELVSPKLTIISDKSSETTAIDRYTKNSTGLNVRDIKTGSIDYRKCLTTRFDGNIQVVFSGFELSVTRHC